MKGQRNFEAEREHREGLVSKLEAARQTEEQAVNERKNASKEFERLQRNFNSQREDDGKQLKKADEILEAKDTELKQAREEVAKCARELREFDEVRQANQRSRLADLGRRLKQKKAAADLKAEELQQETAEKVAKADALIKQTRQLLGLAETNWQNEEKAAAAVKEIKEAIENYQKHLSGDDTYHFLGCLPILKRRTMFFEWLVLKHGETKFGKGNLAKESIEELDAKKEASQKIQWIKNYLLDKDKNVEFIKSRARWFWKAPKKSHGAVLVENIEKIKNKYKL